MNRLQRGRLGCRRFAIAELDGRMVDADDGQLDRLTQLEDVRDQAVDAGGGHEVDAHWTIAGFATAQHASAFPVQLGLEKVFRARDREEQREVWPAIIVDFYHANFV